MPLDDAGDEDREKVGVSGYNFAPSSSGRRRRLTTSPASASSTTSGFIVTWFADVVRKVEAEGGGPVEKVTVKLSHMKLDDSDNVIIDDQYMGIPSRKETDAYGESGAQGARSGFIMERLDAALPRGRREASVQKEDATYVQADPCCSGFGLGRDGDYFPVLDSNNIDTSCNGMPRYECRVLCVWLPMVIV